LLIGLSALFAAGALAASSRAAEAADVRCQIPFSFMVRDTTLPPGVYTLSVESGVLFVRGVHQGVFALTESESGSDTQAKAVFDKDGDEYRLRDVWTGGGSGQELLQPRHPRERAHAAESDEPETSPLERMTIVTVPAF
jgi:hypothetical protein